MERLFQLDAQLIHDTVLLALSVFLMFVLLSYLLFNPARDFLKKRQEHIQEDLNLAKQEKEDALNLKKQFQDRLGEADKEAQILLKDARKKALYSQEQILAEAKREADRRVARANAQIQEDRKSAADDLKREMIQVASLMAEKAIAASITAKIQDELLEDALKEIGDRTWQS